MMNFNYPNLVIAEIEGMRFYKNIDGNIFPSITTILGNTQPVEKIKSLEAWRNSVGNEHADRIINDAAKNGTAVHLLSEYYLKDKNLFNKKIEKFSECQIKLFNSIKPKLKKISKVWGLEVTLFSNFYKIAGRCDCIGIYNNLPTIIDFKTSLKIKNTEIIEDYFLQITAYALMHNELFQTNIENGVILMGSSEFPQEFKIKIYDFRSKLENRINQFYNKFLT